MPPKEDVLEVDVPSDALPQHRPLKNSLAGWLLCQHCDALLHESAVPAGKSAKCPHCGSVLFRHRRNAVQRTLAFSLSGLIFYVPANFLPIMTFELLGTGASSTLLGGVVQLWQQGYYWMAFLVGLCSMLMPLLELSALFILAFAMSQNRFYHWHRHLLRIVHRISEWGMLEVYMLGILVAFIKMSDLGDIDIGIALFCFVGLLVSSMGAAVSFDPHACWQRLDHARRGPL